MVVPGWFLATSLYTPQARATVTEKAWDRVSALTVLLSLEMVFRPSAQLQGQGEAELLEDYSMIDSAATVLVYLHL